MLTDDSEIVIKKIKDMRVRLAFMLMRNYRASKLICPSIPDKLRKECWEKLGSDSRTAVSRFVTARMIGIQDWDEVKQSFFAMRLPVIDERISSVKASLDEVKSLMNKSANTPEEIRGFQSAQSTLCRGIEILISVRDAVAREQQ